MGISEIAYLSIGMVETVLNFGYSKQARHTGENTSQKGFQHEAQPNR
jgi:hypothetical protein